MKKVKALVSEEYEFGQRDELLRKPNFGFFRLSAIQRKHQKEFFIRIGCKKVKLSAESSMEVINPLVTEK